jgi:hypothetical protein
MDHCLSRCTEAERGGRRSHGGAQERRNTYRSNPILEPLEFVVEFAIPRTELQAFFGLKDSVRDYVYGLLDKHCKDA